VVDLAELFGEMGVIEARVALGHEGDDVGAQLCRDPPRGGLPAAAMS
jgi:hypothetical protein